MQRQCFDRLHNHIETAKTALKTVYISTVKKYLNIKIYISHLSQCINPTRTNNQLPIQPKSIARRVISAQIQIRYISTSDVSQLQTSNVASPSHLHSVADDWLLPSNLNWQWVRLMCLFQNVKTSSYFWLWLRHGYSVNSHKQPNQTKPKQSKAKQTKQCT